MPEHSPLASPKATIAALKDHGLYTKKSLGQHFLIDDGVVGKILKLASPTPEATLLEVGPGIGALTLALLKTGNPVIAIEKDAALLPALPDATNFTLLHQDALDLDALRQRLPRQSPLELVANLPYQVAATIVLAYFEHLPQLRAATVMVQREVAERMAANPGTKAYGAYTVKLALQAKATGSFSVARTSFLPPPRVDSTVIRLERARQGTSQGARCSDRSGGQVQWPAIAPVPLTGHCTWPLGWSPASLAPDGSPSSRRAAAAGSSCARRRSSPSPSPVAPA